MRNSCFVFFLTIAAFVSCRPGNEKAVPVKLYSDVDSALSEAQLKHKPVLVLYSAYSSVNSRKMEDGVFRTASVSCLLDSFVVVQLMTDDKTLFPDSLAIETMDGRKIQQEGEWYAMMLERDAHTNAVPAFVVYNEKGKLLKNEAGGYTAAPDEFAAYLVAGLAASHRAVLAATPFQLSACPTTSLPADGIGMNLPDTTQPEIRSWASDDGLLSCTFSARRLDSNRVELTINAGIAKGYMLYALNQREKQAPQSQLLITNLMKNELRELPDQKTQETFIELLECRALYFTKTAKITQVIDYQRSGPYVVSGVVQWMYSDEATMRTSSSQFRLNVR